MKINSFSAYAALVLNILLFCIKIIAGAISGSIALISDAINSFTDIFTSIAIMISVQMGNKKPDESHPFGYHRAEPVGAMIAATVATLLGFEIIKESAIFLFTPHEITINVFVVLVVLITIITKLFMFLFFRKVASKQNTPAVKALSYDAINDVLVTSSVLIGFVLIYFKIPYVDAIIGMFIGIWVIRNAFVIGFENINYLMGKTPEKNIMQQIKNAAKKVPGVKGINDIFAHYVGNFIHVEVHIEIDKKTNLKKAHYIGKKVKNKLESLDNIDRAFIHIDPK